MCNSCMKENCERIWKRTGDDNCTAQDDQFCTTPVFMMGQRNLLEDLSNCFRSLSTMDHTLCPKRVNLLYSKPLSEYSLLPVNKHFQKHSLNWCSYFFWPCCFILRNTVYVTLQGLLKIMLYLQTIWYWLLYMSFYCTILMPQKEVL
jgi:hypothetical protein